MASIPPEALQNRLDLATAIAREAGAVTLELFRTDRLEMERKGDGSPVTVADRRAEQLLRERIAARFPDDAILGEEFPEKSGTSGVQWVLDPIDGTKSFITGVPLYTTLIAVLVDGEPAAGVIHAPVTSETAWARLGGGTWYQDGDKPARRVRVSDTATLDEATFVTSEVLTFTSERERDARHVYDRLQGACRLTRTWGDGYGYILVATGRADIAIDPVMNLWDAAAPMPVILEAGGVFTDWQGKPTAHSGDVMATNPHLAPQVLEILAEA